LKRFIRQDKKLEKSKNPAPARSHIRPVFPHSQKNPSQGSRILSLLWGFADPVLERYA
jgi:hypothetical protein